MTSVSRQDGYHIGQDRKRLRQAVEIPARMVSRWEEPQFESRVSEISNMFDILLIHHNMQGNYNRS